MNIETKPVPVVEQKPKPKSVPTPKFTKVGKMAKFYIKQNKLNSKQIIAKCKKKFPNSAIAKNGPKHIAWYIWRLKKDGVLKQDFKLKS